MTVRLTDLTPPNPPSLPRKIQKQTQIQDLLDKESRREQVQKALSGLWDVSSTAAITIVGAAADGILRSGSDTGGVDPSDLNTPMAPPSLSSPRAASPAVPAAPTQQPPSVVEGEMCDGGEQEEEEEEEDEEEDETVVLAASPSRQKGPSASMLSALTRGKGGGAAKGGGSTTTLEEDVEFLRRFTKLMRKRRLRAADEEEEEEDEKGGDEENEEVGVCLFLVLFF